MGRGQERFRAAGGLIQRAGRLFARVWPSQEGKALKELVEHITKSLVDDPSAVRVEEKVTSTRIIVHLQVAPKDMGRVIGKDGRVANAIRALLKVASTRHGKPYVLEID